ncbi:hypothetical protein BDN67DRAFT_965795, partial [Paxillus ammoniavirescens]
MERQPLRMWDFMGAETIHGLVKSGPWMTLERITKSRVICKDRCGRRCPVLGMFVIARYWNGSVMLAIRTIVPKLYSLVKGS